jgi:uncharacterized protein
MLYAIMTTDIPNSLSLRQQARPAHIARLQKLRDEGRLVIAGPFPAVDNDDPSVAGFTGSLIVAEFASLAHAQSWAEADPYVESGIYAKVIIKPFKQVF